METNSTIYSPEFARLWDRVSPQLRGKELTIHDVMDILLVQVSQSVFKKLARKAKVELIRDSLYRYADYAGTPQITGRIRNFAEVYLDDVLAIDRIGI